MSCGARAFRLGFAAGLAAVCVLGEAPPCFAQESPEPAPDESTAPVAPAPMAELQLTLPARANLGSLGAEASGRWWPSYWETSTVPKPWQGVADADLRLNVETAQWEVGALSLSAAYIVTPERERLCYPECSGFGASSALRLKYDFGDLGPLQELGPEIEFVTNTQDVDMASREDDSPVPRNWLLRIGLSWKF